MYYVNFMYLLFIFPVDRKCNFVSLTFGYIQWRPHLNCLWKERSALSSCGVDPIVKTVINHVRHKNKDPFVKYRERSEIPCRSDIAYLIRSPPPSSASTRKVYEKKLVQLLVSPPCTPPVMNGPEGLNGAQDDDGSKGMPLITTVGLLIPGLGCSMQLEMLGRVTYELALWPGELVPRPQKESMIPWPCSCQQLHWVERGRRGKNWSICRSSY